MQPSIPGVSVPPPRDFGNALMLRRTLLLAARDGSFIGERIDCAELARSLGLDDAARALYDLLFIRTGFAPRQRQWQQEVAARTGLWAGQPAPAVTTDPPGFAIDVAVAELRRLMNGTGPVPIEPHWPDVVEALIADIRPPAKVPPARPPVRPPVPGDMFETCARLRSLLQGPPEAAALADLAALLDRLRHELVEVPPFDVSAEIGDPARLIAALIAADLRGFLIDTLTLTFAPFGSSALMHATARLEPAALGPYLGNVGRLIRSSRDIPGLVQLAGGAGFAGSDRWTTLLSSRTGMSTMLDLVDELGDRGMMRPLWMMLYIVVRELPRHRDLGPLWRIRDAALDRRDWQLAAAAQQAIALWAGDDPVEWRILGEIRVTAGNIGGGRLALVQGARAVKDRGDLRHRLRLLRAGAFESFMITGGFGTPKHRQRRRQAGLPPFEPPVPAGPAVAAVPVAAPVDGPI